MTPHDLTRILVPALLIVAVLLAIFYSTKNQSEAAKLRAENKERSEKASKSIEASVANNLEQTELLKAILSEIKALREAFENEKKNG